jgi:hypothetical protein
MMGVIEVFDDALFCIIHDSTIEKIFFFMNLRKIYFKLLSSILRD